MEEEGQEEGLDLVQGRKFHFLELAEEENKEGENIKTVIIHHTTKRGKGKKNHYQVM